MLGPMLSARSCAWAGGAAAWLPSAASLPAPEPGGPAQLAPWPLSMALPLSGGPGAPPHPAAMLAALHAQQARGAGGWGAPPPGGVPAAAPHPYGGCGGAAQSAWRAAGALQDGQAPAGAGGGLLPAAHDAAALAPGLPGPAGAPGAHATGGGSGFDALGAARAAGGGGQAAGPGLPPGAGAPAAAHLELPRAASPGAGGAAEADMFSQFLLASPCQAPAWPPGEPGAGPAPAPRCRTAWTWPDPARGPSLCAHARRSAGRPAGAQPSSRVCRQAPHGSVFPWSRLLSGARVLGQLRRAAAR